MITLRIDNNKHCAKRTDGTAPQLTPNQALCMLCVIVLITLGLPALTKSDFDGRPRYSKAEIQRAIGFYAQRYHLEPALLRAVIKAESDFRPDAVSRKGAVGLMQLMPDTAAQLRVHDRYDAIQNIRGGAKQLHHLLVLYDGDLRLAIAAYNAGIHRIRGHSHIARIRETRLYVRKVLRYYRAFTIEDERRSRLSTNRRQSATEPTPSRLHQMA